MAYTTKHLVAAGLRTQYLEAGAGEPVVLVHGGGAGADAIGNWSTTIPWMAKRRRVFAVDMVGFGGTDKPQSEDYKYSQQERESHLAAFIAALEVGPVMLIGNSMGGLTSLGVARDCPHLVERLVLMGSAGIPVPMSPELSTIIDYDFTAEGMRRIVEALTGPEFVAPDGLIHYRHQLTLDARTRYAYDRIIEWQKSNGGLHVPEAMIAAVARPTLVVAGKEDRVVPLQCAYRLLELIRQSWGVIMPSCGHWPMIEYPERFANLIDDFSRMQ